MKCEVCQLKIPSMKIVNGVARSLFGRKKCTDCMPMFGLYGRLEPSFGEPIRKCSSCEEDKDSELFFPVRKNGKVSISEICISCRDEKLSARKNRIDDRRYKKYPKKRTDSEIYASLRRDGYYLKRKYGIDSDFFEKLMIDQDGVCAICGGENPNGQVLHVDHDHDSRKVRGLLCRKCNMALGFFGDRIDLMARAIEYLSAQKA